MSDVQTTLRMNDQASQVLQKVANAARQTCMQMQQAGKAADQSFKSNAPNTFASQAGNAMSRVTSEAQKCGDAVDQIFDDASAAGYAAQAQSELQTVTTGADEAATASDELSESLEEAAEAADELGDNIEDVDGGGLDGIEDDIEGIGSGFGNATGMVSKFIGVAAGLAGALGLAKIADEVGDFVKDSAELGKNYSAMMSEVAAISGATGKEYEMLEQTAREYGATTIFSASEAAEALKYMSLAGWNANQSASALGGVLDLAAASGMGLGQASDMVTDYLSAFGMEASQAGYFADMLAYAQANSNTSAEQLGMAYLNSAANLHAAGQDIETTTSLLEAMANQGTKGSRAGTQLAAIARDITNGMEDGAIKIGETSIAVQDAQGNFKDFTEILTDVQGAVDGMGSAERSAALATTFTADSTKGINQILTEGMDNISQYEDQLRNSTGAAGEAAGIMNDNLKGDLANMNSAWEEMQLRVFESMEGNLRSIVQWATNTAIPALTEWVPGAIESVSDAVGKAVIKNPGQVSAGFGALTAGFTAMKLLGTGSSFLGKMAEMEKAPAILGTLAKTLSAGPWVAGGVAAAAAIAGIGIAIKKYNDAKVEESLAEKFGDITLDKDEIEAAAKGILDIDWQAGLEESLSHFETADQFAKTAQEALQKNDVIEWKARVGIELTEEDKGSYKDNVQQFIENQQKGLEEQTLAVQMALSFADIKLPSGFSLNAEIEKWAAEDMGDMSALSNQLSKAVEDALEDGVMDINEENAINELQAKMASIMNKWRMAEDQARMDMLNQKYSGQALTADSFTDLVKELGKQREDASKTLDESNQKAYEAVEAMHNAGRLGDQSYENAKVQIAEAARNENAQALANSIDFEVKSIKDAFGDLNNLSGADLGGMKQMWKAMEPDATAMQQTIDSYVEAGQAIPQALMDSYQSAVEVGAAAGDAGMQKQLTAFNMTDAQRQNVLDNVDSFGSQYADAVKRVGAEVTDEPITIDKALDLEVEGNTDEVGKKAKEINDEAEQTAKEETAGTTEVEKDVKVTENVAEVDTSSVQDAGQEAADQAGTVDTQIPTNASLDVKEVDTSGVSDAVAQTAKSVNDTAKVTIPSQVALKPGKVDTSQVATAARNATKSAFGNAITTPGTVNVNLHKGSDNIGAVYDQVGNAIRSKFSSPFSASAHANIHVNVSYSISGGTKTFTVGGSGSGTLTLHAHALGGFFDQPHMGLVAEAGPEYIIPMDGSDRSRDMWTEAGSMLGMMDQPISYMPSTPNDGAGGGSGSTSTSKNINLNINGSGSMRIQSSMSKEDIVEVMIEHLKDVLMDIVQEEILMEGDGSYEY